MIIECFKIPEGTPEYTVNMLRNKNHYELLIESNSEMHNLIRALQLSELNY